MQLVVAEGGVWSVIASLTCLLCAEQQYPLADPLSVVRIWTC